MNSSVVARAARPWFRLTRSFAARVRRSHEKHGRVASATLRGFTLVEVLATLMLMAIVLPAVMKGIQLSQAAASSARRRTEAAGLAEGKLSEIVATAQWQGGNLSGDFGPGWPDYHWQAVVQAWPDDTTSANLQQIDLKVTWVARGHDDSLTLSTLTYVRGQQ